MNIRLLSAICALLAAILLLTACGDDGGDGSSVAASTTSTTTSGETEGETQNVVIEAEDGAFDAHAIYEAASPGVVTVVSVFDAASGPPNIFNGGGGGGAGQGSGFVISEEGEILTNAHVVTDAEATGAPTGRPLHEADEIYIQFADRNQVSATVVGFDPFSDVALLKVDPEGLDLHVLPLGSEDDVEVGDAVAAIGSPFGQNQSLSVGVVSATDRSIDSLTDFAIDGGIQTDASINPGNSGGPLLDAEGQVVGINQQIQTSSGGNEGVGFAVPIDLAQRAAQQLREDGTVDYAYAGVSTVDLYPQLAERLGLDVDSGALVASVQPDSPAEEAGLDAGEKTITFQGNTEIPEDGDVIVSLNGDPVDSADDLPSTISRLNPGDEVTFGVLRDGETVDVEITLGSRDDAPAA